MVSSYSKQLSYTELFVDIFSIGDDYQILVYGGATPHLGCSVMAIPRASLSDNGQVSCTSSVLNVLGHKDEAICRLFAEEYCKMKNAIVVCSGGFHVDGITQMQIDELMGAIKSIVNEMIDTNLLSEPVNL